MLRIDTERKIAFVEGFPLIHLFTLRSFGNMAVKYGLEAKDHQKKVWSYLEEMGLRKENWIHLIPSKDPGKIVLSPNKGTDVFANAVIVFQQGVVLSLFAGDCYPIFVTDKTHSFLALIHGSEAALRRGRIVQRTIKDTSFASGARPDDLVVGIGPGIKKCCYKRGLKRVDLLGMILEQMGEIPEDNIFIAGVCTACSKWENDYLFFSHRRSKKTGEPEGRFGAFVSLKEP